jgi:hypothetical protein
MIGSERYTCRGSCPCTRTERFPGGLKPCARICTHDGDHECSDCRKARETSALKISAEEVAESFRVVLAANKIFCVTRTREHTDLDVVSRFL